MNLFVFKKITRLNFRQITSKVRPSHGASRRGTEEHKPFLHKVQKKDCIFIIESIKMVQVKCTVKYAREEDELTLARTAQVSCQVS
jgi:hypothetical protein